MPRSSHTLLALALASAWAFSPAAAQTAASSPCVTPDSIAVRGNSRVSDASIRGDAGLAPGTTLNYRTVQRAIETLYATGEFADVRVACQVEPTGRATLVIEVAERPVLHEVRVEGVDRLSQKAVQDRVELVVGRPIDPALVARAVTRIDSLYESKGYYLARIAPETTTVAGRTSVVFRIDEGNRLAISGVRVVGNRAVSTGTIAKTMKTRPEGFWWFRKGEFDEDEYAGDLGDRIPGLYAKRGFIDFRIARDTMLVDRERGKGLIELTVVEGEQYRVGSFDVIGNRRFSTEEIERFYPFTNVSRTLTQRLTGLIRRDDTPEDVFDRSKWEDATQKVRTAYYNEGYIYVSVNPVVERVVGPDSVPTVNLRWEIDEKQPAIINRVEIAGNDYTTEACIRDQLIILPGDVFNQDRLVRSYQNIANMGFFETPVTPPDTRPANEQGDVDIVFNVKEKKTGNINFGASYAQQGVGGFISVEQPNLFGLCKRGSLQWQFGGYYNDVNLSYTDPTIRRSRVSGTLSAYNTRSRVYVTGFGRSTRSGGSLQLGFPVPTSPFARLFLSYGGERIKYTEDQTANSLFRGANFRSTLGLTTTRDTRIDLPFASAGSYQTFAAQFNGGPLGGTAEFQRYTGEARSYATIGQFGGTTPGSQPMKLVLGLTARGGVVAGNTGPFFVSQNFALGGVLYGEQLRGYPEFSITPRGYVPTRGSYEASPEFFGASYFTTTAEVGLRFNQMVYLNAFFDAGNNWARPRDFDPTRLFRGAGLGVSLVTPLGPLGLDWAYGFDRVNAAGVADPQWQFHFKLGQLF